MAKSFQTIIATRGAQMFPTLTDAEIARLRRFGEVRHFAKGEALARLGEAGLGLTIFLAGEAEVTQPAPDGGQTHIVTHGPGSFMGELAQLSGQPMLVNAIALTRGGGAGDPARSPARPARRRGRIGRADHAGADLEAGRPARDRRRRAGDRRPRGQRRRAEAGQFPQPQRPPPPKPRPRPRQLRAHLDRAFSRSSPRNCRSFSARAGNCFVTRPRASLPAALAWSARSIPSGCSTWSSSAPGRRGSRPRSMPDRRG